MDRTRGIGKNGTLPWHLPQDFKQFVRLTTETTDQNKRNAVIMGRKCWESIPNKFRPLKNRLNVVLSTSIAPSQTDDVVFCKSLEDALQILESNDKIETIWNIGGRQLYQLGLTTPNIHKIYLTEIQNDFETDVDFPDFDKDKFQVESVGEKVEDKGQEWKLIVYKNKDTLF
ncbi:unnamed protein product [Bursaphelenchus okinawaensis]|uniref:dihydrofolate reductase n=1 Tax=Bursaphelenchus okinawaensis TaxID=465554 RepID=A0A811JR49_9BILA|nr:unnamed protein product [Bursaphelenchus okinawaensis]CAG9079666.1 unnamed protein product [Bursaphelenchus okinawaensis]